MSPPAAFTLTHSLNRVLPYLPRALVSNPDQRWLRTIGRHVPADLTAFVIFESHLGQAENRADLAFALLREKGEFERLAQFRPASEHPAWWHIKQLARNTLDPEHPLYEKVDNFWFEFDRNQPGDALPPPGFFVGFRKQNIVESNDWLHHLLTAPQSNQFPNAPVLLRCLDALPEETIYLQIGRMFSRPGSAVRLCAHPLLLENLAPFLGDVKWPSLNSKFEHIVAQLTRFETHVAIGLDVNETTAARLGLELFLRDDPENSAQFHDFLDWLGANALCRPDQAQAIRAWPGTTPEQFPHLANNRALIRGIDHLKLIFEHDRLTAAKVYLSSAIAPI